MGFVGNDGSGQRIGPFHCAASWLGPTLISCPTRELHMEERNKDTARAMDLERSACPNPNPILEEEDHVSCR